MQNSNVRPLISVEYLLRISAWILALGTEAGGAALLQLGVVKSNMNFYGVGIAFTALICIAARYMGPFAVIRDFEELCVYDLLVQVYGLALHLFGVSYSSYLILTIAVYLLKVVRLLWWGKNLEGELLCEWPVFGVLGFFAKGRINESISEMHRITIYASIALSIVAAYFVWLFFTQVPQNWFFFLGILPVVALTKRAAMDIQRRDEERIASIVELERTKILAELNADAAARNEDLRGATHDLSNAVSAMRYTARDIVKAADLDSARAIAQNMEAGLGDLTDMISEVVEMARLGTKLKTTQDDVIFMPKLAQEFAEDLGALARERGVILGFNDTEIFIKSNHWLLKRILRNLLTNAIVHARTDKKRRYVTLSARRCGQFCYIRVCDSGAGIPGMNGPDRAANFQSLIFTQASKDSAPEKVSKTVSGHGLGLRGVLRMSNTLGLEITMKSRVGVGTMFRFKVPVATMDDLPDF